MHFKARISSCSLFNLYFCKPDEKQVCERYDFTTTAEVSDGDEDHEVCRKENLILRKKSRKGKQIVYSSDNNSDSDGGNANSISDFPPPPKKFISATNDSSIHFTSMIPRTPLSRSRSPLREKPNSSNRPRNKQHNELVTMNKHFSSSSSKHILHRTAKESQDPECVRDRKQDQGRGPNLLSQRNKVYLERKRPQNTLDPTMDHYFRELQIFWHQYSLMQQEDHDQKPSLDHDQKQDLDRLPDQKEMTERDHDRRQAPGVRRESFAENTIPEKQHERSFGIENTVARSNSGFPISEAKFQRRVLQLLTEIRNSVAQVGKRCSPANSAVHIDQATSLEELIALESSLADKDTRDVLLSRIIDIGGLNVRENVRNVMHRLMNNEVMASMNMKGKGSKYAFGSTKVFQAVVECVVKNQKTSEAEVKQAVQQLLKYAPDRQGGGGRKDTA
ncbi:uncharacterized protein LOC114539299 [Dendronephthya gigantea]|uniref:uncharacterized protein LOC114539299 n=1 Tax=Dendronephthya gigantea TaxID=151771 RepID=UPI0010696D31|nr:uncharacterized protein LOC114539299 [Dendronephthya gigantea]